MTTDELRAKFEAWAAARGLRIRRHDIRAYWYVETLAAWEIWQAAHASRDAEVEALRRDAERYRWLSRKHANPVEKDWYVYGATSPFLSDSIDAAMAKESWE